MDKYHKEFYEEMKYKTKDWQFKNWFVFANLMGACAEIETKHFGRIDGKDVVWLMERTVIIVNIIVMVGMGSLFVHIIIKYVNTMRQIIVRNGKWKLILLRILR